MQDVSTRDATRRRNCKVMCSIGKLEMNDLDFIRDRCKHHESDFFFTGIQWGVQICAWASIDTSGIALAFFQKAWPGLVRLDRGIGIRILDVRVAIYVQEQGVWPLLDNFMVSKHLRTLSPRCLRLLFVHEYLVQPVSLSWRQGHLRISLPLLRRPLPPLIFLVLSPP